MAIYSNNYNTISSPVQGGYSQPGFTPTSGTTTGLAANQAAVAQILPVLELMLSAISQMQQGWGGAAGPQSLAQPAPQLQPYQPYGPIPVYNFPPAAPVGTNF